MNRKNNKDRSTFPCFKANKNEKIDEDGYDVLRKVRARVRFIDTLDCFAHIHFRLSYSGPFITTQNKQPTFLKITSYKTDRNIFLATLDQVPTYLGKKFHLTLDTELAKCLDITDLAGTKFKVKTLDCLYSCSTLVLSGKEETDHVFLQENHGKIVKALRDQVLLVVKSLVVPLRFGDFVVRAVIDDINLGLQNMGQPAIVVESTNIELPATHLQEDKNNFIAQLRLARGQPAKTPPENATTIEPPQQQQQFDVSYPGQPGVSRLPQQDTADPPTPLITEV